MGNFEDAVSAADFAPFEKMSREVLPPVLHALSDEEVLEGLRVLLTHLRSWMERALENADGDVTALTDTIRSIGQSLVALKPVAAAVLPVAVKIHGPRVVSFLEERGGGLAADAVNSVCAVIGRNPEIASRFVSDLFVQVDGHSFRKAMDTLVGAVLDQRPPLAGWTASTVAKRARKRVLVRRGGRHGRD